MTSYARAYYSLIYSQKRLGQIAQAKSNLITYDQKCAFVKNHDFL